MKRGGWGGGNEMERQEWVECLSERERMCVCVGGRGGRRGGAYEGMKESDTESVRKPEKQRRGERDRKTDIDRETDIQRQRD